MKKPIIINSPLEALHIALLNNPELKEKRWAIMSYRALEKKAQRSIYPSLELMGFVAPIYKITSQEKNIYDYQRDYSSWGPVYQLQGTIIQPIFTFGRYSKGKEAAKWGVKAKIAEKRQKANEIRLSIYRYFWGYQLANSLMDLSVDAMEIFQKILTKAQDEYDAGTGKVSLMELSRLKLYKMEILKQQEIIKTQRELAIFALKREMGLKVDQKLQLKVQNINIKGFALQPLSFYTKYALDKRPELKQVTAGIHAFKSLSSSKSKENYPVFVLGGQIMATHTPQRHDFRNPNIYDPYNNITGNIGLGFQWKFDSGQKNAEAENLMSKAKKLEAKKEFAEISIPLETRKAYLELNQAMVLKNLSKRNIKITKKWSVSAQLKYDSGLLGPKDLIEGLAAYFKSRIDYKKSLYDIHIGLAVFGKTIGNHSLLLERKK